MKNKSWLMKLNEQTVTLIRAEKLLDTPIAPPTTSVKTATAETRKSVRLPELQLRQFDGDLNKWTSFWQLLKL